MDITSQSSPPPAGQGQDSPGACGGAARSERFRALMAGRFPNRGGWSRRCRRPRCATSSTEFFGRACCRSGGLPRRGATSPRPLVRRWLMSIPCRTPPWSKPDASSRCAPRCCEGSALLTAAIATARGITANKRGSGSLAIRRRIASFRSRAEWRDPPPHALALTTSSNHVRRPKSRFCPQAGEDGWALGPAPLPVRSIAWVGRVPAAGGHGISSSWPKGSGNERPGGVTAPGCSTRRIARVLNPDDVADLRRLPPSPTCRCHVPYRGHWRSSWPAPVPSTRRVSGNSHSPLVIGGPRGANVACKAPLPKLVALLGARALHGVLTRRGTKIIPEALWTCAAWRSR